MYNGHREGALVAERLQPEIRNPVVRTTFPFLLVLSTHCALHTWYSDGIVLNIKNIKHSNSIPTT